MKFILLSFILILILVIIFMNSRKTKWTFLLLFIFPVVVFKDLTERNELVLGMSSGGYFGVLFDLIFSYKNYPMHYFVVYYSLFFSFISTLFLYKFKTSRYCFKHLLAIYKKLFVLIILMNTVLLILFIKQILNLLDIIKENQSKYIDYSFLKQYFNIVGESKFNIYFSIIYVLMFFSVFAFVKFKRKQSLKNYVVVFAFILSFPIISIKNNELRFNEDNFTRTLIAYPLSFALFSTSISYLEDNEIENKSIQIDKLNKNYYYHSKIIDQNPSSIRYYTYFQITMVLLLFPSILIAKEEKNI